MSAAPLKISVITVVFNGENTIADAIASVASQDYQHVEHIVIDGASTDRTRDIIEDHRSSIDVFVSEPDQGIYDAMNKGIRLATGAVIGLLNADDVYQDSTVLSQVAQAHADSTLDACYADLVYVQTDDLQKVARYWRSRDYQSGLGFTGWMPAHPTFYLKKRVYDQVGLYDENLIYQADLEFCVRVFEVHKIRSLYVPQLWIRMRLGGVTNNSIAGMIKGNWESYLALKKLGLQRNMFSYFAAKFAPKLLQFRLFEFLRRS